MGPFIKYLSVQFVTYNMYKFAENKKNRNRVTTQIMS